MMLSVMVAFRGGNPVILMLCAAAAFDSGAFFFWKR